MAAEQLYVLGDIGATNTRVAIYNETGTASTFYSMPTEVGDYDSMVELVADTAERLASMTGTGLEIASASVAVAARVDEDGVLTKSGDLTPWLGRNLGADLAQALGLEPEQVGTPNDAVAIALSQQYVNQQNGQPVQGYATTLSSGWGGAMHWAEAGRVQGDEPGHEFLRDGAVCPCGGEGHAEAFISGKGVENNHGFSMSQWLEQTPGAPTQMMDDVTTAMVAAIRRVERASRSDFHAEELRWTGGVALNQPFIMAQVAERIREYFAEADGRRLVVDTVTTGEHAGLHGTFIDAQMRADAR
jgi:predicted NBD/HSP70 family sugar kinase